MDDLHFCVDIMNGMLKHYNLPTMTIDKYRDIFTIPVSDYYKLLGYDLSNGEFERLGKEFIDTYEERKTECRLFEDAVDTLNFVKDKGMSQSVLSGYYHQTLVDLIEYYKITPYFIYLQGIDDIYANSKIDHGKKLINKLGIPANEILIIGDTIHDYEVAQELGTDTIFVTTGHQSKPRLETIGIPIINSLNELKALIK